MHPKKKSYMVIVFVTFAFILIISLLIIGLSTLLLPKITTNFQAWIFWGVGIIIVIIGALANIAQLSGFNVKELLTKNKGNFESDLDTKNNRRNIDLKRKLRLSKINSLVSQIRPKIFSEDNDLPNTIVLSLTLCKIIGKLKDYSTWLSFELNGYEPLKDKILSGDKEALEYLKKWGSHRYVEIYIKIPIYFPETGRYINRTFPVGDFFLIYSIPYIIKELKRAESEGQFEYSYYLFEIDNEKFINLQEFFKSEYPKIQIPSDILCFHRVTEITKIVNGVRGKIVNLLNEINE